MLRTQIPTPTAPQPPTTSIPQQQYNSQQPLLAAAVSALPLVTAPTPPPAAPPIPLAIPTAAPLVVPTAAPPATPIAAPPATPIAAPAAPATPPGPQSSNYNQLLWSRKQQPQQLHTHTPPEPAGPSVEQRPRQGPRYSKEVAIIAKIYTDD